jgi:hypothetical protein
MAEPLFGGAALGLPPQAGDGDFDFYGPAELPTPTDAPPGSRRKVRVMCHRFRLRQELFHFADAGSGERFGFAAIKNSGSNGEKFRGGLLRLLDGGRAAVDY